MARKSTTGKKSRAPKKRKPVKADATASHAGLGFHLENEDIELALRTGDEAGALEDYFGREDYEELRQLAQQASAKRSAAGPRVLILPGITGSKLGIRKGKKREDVVWFDPLELARGGIDQIAIDSGVKIESVGVILLFYLKLKLRLRAAGFDAEFHDYDWRQSIDSLGAGLADRIRKEVTTDQISLVCHSMGGLVARAAMTSLGAAKDKVAHVIQLGTPNFGSFAAVQTLRALGDTVKKLAFLDLKHDAEEIVSDVLAPMPGCCQLLPSPERYNAIDLFDLKSWPTNGPKLNAAVLRQVPSVLKKLAPADDHFFLIAGVNQPTLTGMRFDEQAKEFIFEQTSAGDGTVPLSLAALPGVKATYYVEEAHGSLPNNKNVARAVADLLSTGATTVLPTTPPPMQRAAGREFTEKQLREQQPYPPRRSARLSQREIRDLLSEFVSVETADAQDAPSSGDESEPAQLVDRVVIGRRRQHRIDLRLVQGDICDVNTHAVIVGIYKAVAPTGAAKALDLRLDDAITDLTQRRMFSGNVGEIFLLPTAQRSVRAELVAFAGLGAFDTFNDEVLRTTAENAIRTLIHGGVSDVATVLIGAGSGTGTQHAIRNLVAGFVKGLLDVDDHHRFRSLTVCEADPERYEEIKQELVRLSTTSLFENIEVTFFEEELQPSPTPAFVERAAAERRPDPVYLLVRHESPNLQESVFHTSVLGAGGKATVVNGTRSIRNADLDGTLEEVLADDFSFEKGNRIGKVLADEVLSKEAIAALSGLSGRHVVVVHDAVSSRIPWELLTIPSDKSNKDEDRISLARRGGVSRRYVADNMSVAKWLEQRRQDQDFNVLLVINPTRDLADAEEEGKRVRALLEKEPTVNIDELRGDAATRPALERAFRSGKYDVIHYAGHAFFDPDDTGRSGIICAGDSELSGRDLAGFGNLPSLVFFNACEAGRIRKIRGRKLIPKTAKEKIDRTVGLAEAFLRGGVANYVGTYWPVGDAAAKAFAENFYKSLLRGQTAGEALLAGRSAVYKEKSVDWADYIHYGSQDFVLKIR